MELDQSALQSLIEANGNEVYTVSYDGGSPGHTGNAGVIHCLDSYWSYDDNGNFGGPYNDIAFLGLSIFAMALDAIVGQKWGDIIAKCFKNFCPLLLGNILFCSNE